MSYALTERKDTARAMIEKHQDKIAALLPTHVNVERFAKSALLAISRNPALEECTPQSVFTSVLNAAELGLDFTPAKGHAYLVPYKNVATFMPGYRGMIDLAKRSGTVRRIEAHVVYKNDKFTLKHGLNPVLDHEPTIEGNPGDMIGAYAIAWFKDGETQYEFMMKGQIDGIRKRAKTDYIWKSDYTEMARKTAVRRLFKYLPCSPDLEKAIEYDNATTGIDTIEPSGESGNRTSDLASLVSEMNETETTEADFEDVFEPTELPKTKAEFISEIVRLNKDKYHYPDDVFLGIVGYIVGSDTPDLDALKKEGVEKVYTVFADEAVMLKTASEYEAASKGDNLFDKGAAE